MRKEVEDSLQSFLLEFVAYSGMVAAYFFLVLEFLGPWLDRLYEHDRRTYAALSLGLILGQGFLLEILTRFLLQFIRTRSEKR
jgi:hypothetical protein